MASPIAAEVMEQVEITGVLCLGNAKQDAIDALKKQMEDNIKEKNKANKNGTVEQDTK